MVTFTDSVASAPARSDSSLLQASSSKSTGSFAEQFASVIDQFLGQSQTGSQIEINIDAAPGRAPDAPPGRSGGGCDGTATPPSKMPVPSTTARVTSTTTPSASAPPTLPAPPVQASGTWMSGDPAGAGQSPPASGVPQSQDPFSGAIVDSSHVPGVPALGTVSEVQWYQLLQRVGLIGGPPPPPTIPGYIAPANPAYITVAPGPAGPGGTYIGLEGKIQSDVQGLVGAIASQGLSDAQVSDLLTQDMISQNAYLNGQDPNSANIPALVAKYVAVYRNAVTLPAATAPPSDPF